jgi:Tol biopolymer transport system component
MSFAFGTLMLIIFPHCSFGQAVAPWIDRWARFAGGGEYTGTRPSFSPEGAFVVYSTPATGHGDLYRFDRRTGKNTRLTSGLGYHGDAVYSRDGKRIFFLEEANRVGHIWSMDADGSHRTRLTNGPTYDTISCFSRDGSMIVFNRMQEGFSHIWVMSADGSGQKELTSGSWWDVASAFALDGSRILFSRQEERRIRLMPVTGGASLRFFEVFVMNADGKDQRRLTNNLGVDTPLCFSQDGKQIFYYRQDEYGKVPPFQGLSVMGEDGSNSRDLVQGYQPAVSPDRRRFAFITFGPMQGLPEPGVGLINADGTDRRTVYTSYARPTEPAFALDGSTIVFVEWPDEHGAGRIKILDLQTSKVEAVPKID